MRDERKTKKQLVEELENLRNRVSELEKLNANADIGVTGNKAWENQEKYRTIIKDMTELYFENDLAGNLTFLNDSMCRISGYSRDELMGMNNRDYTTPETGHRMYGIFSGIYRTGNPAHISDYEIIVKDGSKKVVALSASLMRDSAGKPVGFFGIGRDVTERVKMEEELRKSEETYRAVLENIEDGYFEVDLSGNATFFNDSMCRISGYSYEELMGMNNLEYTSAETAKDMYRVFNKVYRTGQPGKIKDYEIIKLDGSLRAFELSVSLIRNADGSPCGFCGIARDVTERKWAEEEIRASGVRYRTIFENTGTAMLMLEDDMTISMVNGKFEEMAGYTADEIEGKKKWVEFVVENDLEKTTGYHRMRRDNPDAAPANYEFRMIGRERRIRDIFLTSAMIPETKRSVVSLVDITERKEIEEKLRYMGTHDDLTGLYNRAFFEAEMARFEQGRAFPISIVMADVDGLKMVNDTKGHRAGDELLKLAAQVMREAFRADDIVARIGGDEFAAILPGKDSSVTESIVERVRSSLPFHNEDYPDLLLTLSIGTAEGKKGDILANVHKRADKLMYEEKKRKKGNRLA